MNSILLNCVPTIYLCYGFNSVSDISDVKYKSCMFLNSKKTHRKLQPTVSKRCILQVSRSVYFSIFTLPNMYQIGKLIYAKQFCYISFVFIIVVTTLNQACTFINSIYGNAIILFHSINFSDSEILCNSIYLSTDLYLLKVE